MSVPVVYVFPGAQGSAPRWSSAFARGCGGELKAGLPFAVDRPIAFWGEPRLWKEFVGARELAPAWYYGDHGFFGRGKFYRCAKNALQFDGMSGDDDPSRFRGFRIPVSEWRSKGEHILLCPNSETFLGLHGMKPGQWVEEVTGALRAHTERPIRLRWKADPKPLSDELKGCWAVVTFTSNAAVTALLAGVPAFCTGPCAGLAMGSVDLTQIEAPATPEGRERWAARLANHQWTLDEMRAGALWNAIGG